MVRAKTSTIVLGGKTIKFIKGALHRQLSVPESKKVGIGNMRKIVKAPIGSTVKINTSKKPSFPFKVTALMKRRAQFGLNITTG
tara:strand:+ start:941 stop:1192 length:252 start_codon:yes stop_codon:yes gene_type:complete